MTDALDSRCVLPPEATASLALDRVHALVVPGVRFVNLRALDFEWQDLGDLPCRLQLEGREIVGQTDADGRVSFKIPMALWDAQGLLHVETDAHGWTHGRGLALSKTEPVESPAGQRARLENLGYVAIGCDSPTDLETPSVWAIEEFQCEHGLTVTGECDPETQAKLVEVHGH